MKEYDQEPMYDDYQLELIAQQDRELLVKALYEYYNELCDKIGELRDRINYLDKFNYSLLNLPMSKYSPPYPDLHGDIYEDFSGYSAYEEFKHIFEEVDDF